MSATCDLPAVQAAIAARGVGCFTRSALDGIRDMGLTSTEALAILEALNVGHFYKTMPAVNNPGLFQAPTPAGWAYVKLMHDPANARICISFKAL
ncbi:type II toxin-antitoxin system MqsR family toxin [Luteimonas sp. MC1825]|uniref:type II toxin-antitoxin system MqsR family toxin n=1 Tax=Luteimonas sp. MC1825 TaxID=2761107 RepID=UPI00160AF2D4|nr:type II toxin-antitoxin system MqsR family toxin [Luteimonas sp. MC1825]MBB6599602.1 type II toxin-antitoxin system MqsR family toxin [Luteimonas sp. MC1825]QOC87295.1 type II toxin-antitoxin system MqsR family toxin [Luteimonas sp. MC1825]